MSGDDAGPDQRPVRERVASASNVLLLAPVMGGDSDGVCIDLLRVGEPASRTVLFVTFTQPAAARLEFYHEAGDGDPAAVSVVDVAAGPMDGPEPGSGASPDATTVTNPEDLTGLGIAINERLSDWADGGHRVTLCFHSLTTLLQYASDERVFRFLHVLTRRLRSLDAVGHYHLDPTAVDDRTVHTFLQLFDAVVKLESDGSTSVMTR